MLCPVFQNTNPGVERLGVPPMQFNEALHGVVVNCGPTYNGNTGCPTSFPHATALGATFNRRCVSLVSVLVMLQRVYGLT